MMRRSLFEYVKWEALRLLADWIEWGPAKL